MRAMTLLRRIRLLILLLSLSAGGCAGLTATDTDVIARSTRGAFDDVKERLVFALENRGLVITYTAKVGDMLDRTGRDIGETAGLYGKAEVLTFCIASISRETMVADAVNIAHCPYAIAVYTLAAESDRVYLAYRVPGRGSGGNSGAALAKVQRLLDALVREAAP